MHQWFYGTNALKASLYHYSESFISKIQVLQRWIIYHTISVMEIFSYTCVHRSLTPSWLRKSWLQLGSLLVEDHVLPSWQYFYWLSHPRPSFHPLLFSQSGKTSSLSYSCPTIILPSRDNTLQIILGEQRLTGLLTLINLFPHNFYYSTIFVIELFTLKKKNFACLILCWL